MSKSLCNTLYNLDVIIPPRMGLLSKSTSSQSSKELVHDQKNVLGSGMRHLHYLPI